MINGKRRKSCIFHCLKVGGMALLGFCFLGPSRPGIAGDVQVVKGIVGTVSGSSIALNGKSVDVADIPIRDPSGTKLFLSDITPGKKVGLWYRRGRMVSVLVYGPMVE